MDASARCQRSSQTELQLLSQHLSMIVGIYVIFMQIRYMYVHKFLLFQPLDNLISTKLTSYHTKRIL